MNIYIYIVRIMVSDEKKLPISTKYENKIGNQSLIGLEIGS